MHIILSNFYSISFDGVCREQTTVDFWYSLRLFRYFITFRAELLSSPEVGSSSMQSFEPLIKSNPMDVLFLSPPDSPLKYFPPTGVS